MQWDTIEYDPAAKERRPWNAGRMVGAKRALKPRPVWAIRFWLDRERRLRDRAMFDLAIDSKLRGCDVVTVRIGDLVSDGQIRSRAIVIQQKTVRLLGVFRLRRIQTPSYSNCLQPLQADPFRPLPSFRLPHQPHITRE
jgi:hypothetical protein